MSAEMRSTYGYNASFTSEEMLEETLSLMLIFPKGMIKEMNDGYRARGITPSVKEGYWDDGYVSSMDFITGYIRISSSNLDITLYSVYALGHEIGHAIDNYLGRVMGRTMVSPGLASFNGGAKYGDGYVEDVFTTWYASTSSAEDFAEMAQELFYNPEYVRDYMRKNPDTPLTKKYNYIIDLIADGFRAIDSKESAFPAIFAIDVFLNGEALVFDVPARLINGRTMVPLRPIFEAMGASVRWNGAAQTVTATKGDTVVVMTMGSTSPTINGRVVPIDQPGVVISGRTLAPLRFVAEAFGGTVTWNGAERTARIVI